MKVCVVGASGKLGKYMVRHALDRGYEVVGVCREKSVGKLDEFGSRAPAIVGCRTPSALEPAPDHGDPEGTGDHVA